MKRLIFMIACPLSVIKVKARTLPKEEQGRSFWVFFLPWRFVQQAECVISEC